MHFPLLAAAMIALPLAAAAQPEALSVPGGRGPTVSARIPTGQQPGPYSKLFSGQLNLQTAEEGKGIVFEPGKGQPAVVRPRTKVVCGMTLILVDPADVDPKMPTQKPDDGTRFTMRQFPAPACRDK